MWNKFIRVALRYVKTFVGLALAIVGFFEEPTAAPPAAPWRVESLGVKSPGLSGLSHFLVLQRMLATSQLILEQVAFHQFLFRNKNIG